MQKNEPSPDKQTNKQNKTKNKMESCELFNLKGLNGPLNFLIYFDPWALGPTHDHTPYGCKFKPYICPSLPRFKTNKQTN